MPVQQFIEPAYGDAFISVLARAEGLRAPRHVDIDWNLYPVQRIFPPGLFAGTTAQVNRQRLLPRVIPSANVTTAQNTIQCPPFLAALFVPSDVITLINANGTAGSAVGTVQSVNAATSVITLAANSVTALTAGVSTIGVATSVPLGAISPNTAINFQDRPNSQFGAFTGFSAYRSKLPYWDLDLKARFPDIVLVDDFT